MKCFFFLLSMSFITALYGQMIPIVNHHFPIEILNYKQGESIQKLKKLEIGIILNDQITDQIKGFLEPEIFPNEHPLNPFLEWSVNIEVDFEHEASDYKKTRDFFYYKEFTRNPAKNDWTDQINNKNKYLMRARFAPTESGIWTMFIRVKIEGKLISEYDAGSFKVEDNDHPGYVTVHSNKRNFERGGEIIYPLGQVFPGPYNDVAIWSSSPENTHKAAGSNQWVAFHKDVRNYIESGGKFIKTCETAYGNLLEFEQMGNYYNRMHYAWEQDKLIDLCEENDVLIYFNLLFQDVFMTYGQSGSGQKNEYGPGYAPVPWDYGNYGPFGEVNEMDNYPTYGYFENGKKPSDMFLGEDKLKYHKQRTRYYIARYGYSPQIYMYELLSEPWHLNQHGDYRPGEDLCPETETVIKALDHYNNEMSNYIKDELNQKEQLISICQFIRGEDIDPVVWQYSAANSNIDAIGVNLYGDGADKLVRSKSSKSNLEVTEEEKSQFKETKWVWDEFQKPLILSESGHYSYACNDFIGHTIDAMTLGFTGVGAVTIWNGYIDGKYGEDTRVVWPETVNASNFMNSEMVISTLGKLN